MIPDDSFEGIHASLHLAMREGAYRPEACALIDQACGVMGSRRWESAAPGASTSPAISAAVGASMSGHANTSTTGTPSTHACPALGPARSPAVPRLRTLHRRRAEVVAGVYNEGGRLRRPLECALPGLRAHGRARSRRLPAGGTAAAVPVMAVDSPAGIQTVRGCSDDGGPSRSR